MSEVVGSVILVGISVFVLAGFGAAVLSTVTHAAPQVPVATFQMTPVNNTTSVNVTFFTGTPYNTSGAAFVMLVNGTDRTGTWYVNGSQADHLFHPGDTLVVNVTGAPLAPGNELLFLANDRETGRSIGTAHATILAASTSPGYTEDQPFATTGDIALAPSPLVADGQSLANLTLTLDSTRNDSRGLALVRAVYANLTPIGGPSQVAMLDDGNGADALAGDGIFTASITARNVTFVTSSLAQAVQLNVTITDILGKTLTIPHDILVSPPPLGPVVQGASYGPILSSAQLGWLNFTQFAFRDTTQLTGDQILLRVQDGTSPTTAWSALATFDASCNGVTSVTFYRDGVAGSASYSPSGGCFPLTSSSQLDLANLNASTNATGGLQVWLPTSGNSTFLYSNAGIGATNHATVTFYGDTNTTAPTATGLGENEITWGPKPAVNAPPTASILVTGRPDFSPYMQVSVDGSGSNDSDGWIVSYAWDWGDSTTSTGPTASHTYATAGHYTITLTVTDDGGATGTATRAVTADHPPTAAFSSSATALTVNFTSTSTDPDAGDALTYAWEFGDGATSTLASPSHTYVTGGNYTANLTVVDTIGGLSNRVSHVVAPNRPPVIASATTSTSNRTAFWNVSASDADGQPIQYLVMWGDGNLSVLGDGPTAAFSHTYAANGTYPATVFVNDTFNASASASASFTVALNAPPNVSAATAQTNLLAAFVNASAADPEGEAITYTVVWNDGNFDTAGNVSSIAKSHAYAAIGVYTITLYVNDSQGGSTSRSFAVVIDQPPTITGVSNTTSSLNATLTVTASDPDAGDNLTYDFAWGDSNSSLGGSSSVATHTYSAAGSYTVTITTHDSLGKLATTTYAVLPNVVPVIGTITNTTSALNVTLTVPFTDTDSGQTWTRAYVWGDGAVSASGTSPQTHTYASAGSYTVRVYVNDSLGGNATKTYAVLPNVVPVLGTITNTTASLNVTVTASATDTDAGQTLTYAFAWGDGTSSSGTASQLHVYASAGSYTVTVYANDTLGGSASTAYAVLPNVVPVIGTITNSTSGLGVTLTVPFTDTDAGQSWTRAYVWGDGSVTTSGSSPQLHTYAAAGAYTVRVYVNDSLGGSATATYAVLPNQAPIITGVTNTTTDLAVTVNVAASDPDGQTLTYAYVWGDGAVTQGAGASQLHSYATAGSYTVRVYANDTLGGSATTTYAVLPDTVPVIGTITNTTASLNVTLTVPFTDPDAQTWTRAYVWGDGQVTASGTSPQTHTYATAGAYTVRVYVNDSLGASATTTYAVLPNVLPVIGSITNTTASLNVTLTVPFTDTDAGQTWTRAYVWGDGQVTASGTSPQTHTYAAAGAYTVRVYVNDSLGGSATATYAVLPNVVPLIGTITNATSALNVTLTVPFTDTDSGQTWTTTFVWGDGTVNTNAAHTFASAGSYSVRVYVNDSLGGSATTTYAVLPDSPPTITGTPNSTAALAAFLNATATDTDAGQTLTYTVAWGDASGTSSGSSGSFSHLYASAGTYTATLYVNDTLGGWASRTVTYTVSANTPPIVDTFTHVTNLLVGFVNITSHDPDVGDSVATVVVAWGDGSTPTSTLGSTATVSHTYVAGSYTVTIYANDTRGGSTSQTTTLTPNRPPTFTSLTNTTSDLNATLTPTASDPDGQTVTYTYAWGDGATTTTTSTPQTHQYALPGNYTVTVYANDTLGGSATLTNVVMAIQTIYVGAVDNSFASPGGTWANLGNIVGADGATATLTEGATTSATFFPTATNDRDFNTSTGSWVIVNSSSVSLSYASGGGNPGGAIDVRSTGGQWNATLEDAFTLSSPATAASTFTIDSMTSNGAFTFLLIKPDLSSVTLGTSSASSYTTTTATIAATDMSTTGTYKVRVSITGSGNNKDNFVDNVAITAQTVTNERAQKLLTLTPVPTSAGLNHYLQINAKQTANAETLQVQVFDGTSWNIRANVTTTTLTQYVVKLNPVEYNSGTIQVRLVDGIQSGDTAASTWDIDYIRDVVYG